MPRSRLSLPIFAAEFLTLTPLTHAQPPELGLGWLPEFDGAARQ